jgi:hypothetical protein
MSKKPRPQISAQVLLKPASGSMPRDADITAANIRAIAPEPKVAADVARRFKDAGFDVGPVVGATFSITGPASVFTRFFKVASPGSEPGEISLDSVPAPVRRAVAAVIFPSPPDFGPGNFA